MQCFQMHKTGPQELKVRISELKVRLTKGYSVGNESICVNLKKKTTHPFVARESFILN